MKFAAPARRIAALLATLVAGLSTHATEGYELIGYGPVSKGVAGAGAASAEDSGWTLLNPATIVDVDPRLDVYIDVIHVHRSVEAEGIGGYKLGGRQHHRNTKPAPGIGYIWGEGDLRFGVGIFGGGGTDAHYGDPRSILGIIGNGDRRAELLIARLPLTVAREFDNGWSLGFSFITSINLFRTDNATLRLRPTRGGYHWDEGYGFGFVVGARKEWERLSLGAAVTSPQWTDGFGKYGDLLLNKLDQPPKLQAGLSFEVTPELEVLLDYKWIGWAQVNQFGKGGLDSALGWSDQHLIKGGLRYRPNERWTLRAGFSHGDSPIDSEDVFLNALFPAITENHLAGGFSYRWKPSLEFHASITHAFERHMTDNGQGDIFSKIGRGTEISLTNTSLQLGLTWHF